MKDNAGIVIMFVSMFMVVVIGASGIMWLADIVDRRRCITYSELFERETKYDVQFGCVERRANGEWVKVRK